jgi:hypothetical protein
MAIKIASACSEIRRPRLILGSGTLGESRPSRPVATRQGGGRAREAGTKEVCPAPPASTPLGKPCAMPLFRFRCGVTGRKNSGAQGVPYASGGQRDWYTVGSGTPAAANPATRRRQKSQAPQGQPAGVWALTERTAHNARPAALVTRHGPVPNPNYPAPAPCSPVYCLSRSTRSPDWLRNL